MLLAALNEAETLEAVLHEVLRVEEPLELIMVDDGSTDSTWQIMQSFLDNGGPEHRRTADSRSRRWTRRAFPRP